MTRKHPKGLGKETAGTLVVLGHGSRILEGNSLGDTHARKLGVWERDGALDWLRAAWKDTRKGLRPYTGEP